jgi:hypothetical protein
MKNIFKNNLHCTTPNKHYCNFISLFCPSKIQTLHKCILNMDRVAFKPFFPPTFVKRKDPLNAIKDDE